MCELFGRDKDYFNAVYSDKQLDIEQGRLYSVTTKEEIKKSAGA
jgi:putative ABC transport system permease protein